MPIFGFKVFQHSSVLPHLGQAGSLIIPYHPPPHQKMISRSSPRDDMSAEYSVRVAFLQHAIFIHPGSYFRVHIRLNQSIPHEILSNMYFYSIYPWDLLTPTFVLFSSVNHNQPGHGSFLKKLPLGFPGFQIIWLNEGTLQPEVCSPSQIIQIRRKRAFCHLLVVVPTQMSSFTTDFLHIAFGVAVGLFMAALVDGSGILSHQTRPGMGLGLIQILSKDPPSFVTYITEFITDWFF